MVSYFGRIFFLPIVQSAHPKLWWETFNALQPLQRVGAVDLSLVEYKTKLCSGTLSMTLLMKQVTISGFTLLFRDRGWGLRDLVNATPGSSATCISIVGGDLSFLEMQLHFFSIRKRSGAAICFCLTNKVENYLLQQPLPLQVVLVWVCEVTYLSVVVLDLVSSPLSLLDQCLTLIWKSSCDWLRHFVGVIKQKSTAGVQF